MVVLDAKERDSLHREVRHQDPDVWEPACHRLGELAAGDQTAYRVLCDLLLSPVPELRLKGLVAMRIMAPAKPREVLTFLTDRVAEARINYDPILLDAAFFAFTALPEQLGRKVVEGYLDDASEVVRAAAAAALCFWRDWPVGTFARVAGDSSVLVKAGLITALSEIEDSNETLDALRILKHAPAPELIPLLDELDNPPTWPPLRPVEPLDEVEVKELLSRTHPRPVSVSRLEQNLTDDPTGGLLLVRNSLHSPGGAVVLEQLSDLCRDGSRGTLFRAWRRILTWGENEPIDELLLQVLGILDDYPKSNFLASLREFVKACAQAADCRTSVDIVAWACTRQVASAALSIWNPGMLSGQSLAQEAGYWLETLANMSGDFQGTSLFQLSNLNTKLSTLYSELNSSCPLPERLLLQGVVEHWQRLLQLETDNMMGGGEAS